MSVYQETKPCHLAIHLYREHTNIKKNWRRLISHFSEGFILWPFFSQILCRHTQDTWSLSECFPFLYYNRLWTLGCCDTILLPTHMDLMHVPYCSSRTANHFCSCSSLFTPQISGATSRISGVSEAGSSNCGLGPKSGRVWRLRRHPDSSSASKALYILRLAAREEIVNPFQKLCWAEGEAARPISWLNSRGNQRRANVLLQDENIVRRKLLSSAWNLVGYMCL